MLFGYRANERNFKYETIMSTSPVFRIQGRRIADDSPVYVIAELSANHHQSLENALRLVEVAREVGADAVKLQTYTPDTITLDCKGEPFRIGKGTAWEGRSLHDVYSEAYTPWEWHPEIKAKADELGLDCFSSPFDFSAVDFLEEVGVPAYKIASFELVDIPLIQRVAATRKPLIMSTGMATKDEIEEAVQAFRLAGGADLALLKCTSSYPSPPEEMNLRTIPDLFSSFGVVAGLSDHSMDSVVPVAAVSVGARIIEKHLTLSRTVPGPDSSFSLEPAEFAETVKAVRTCEAALGKVNYAPTPKESATRLFRRSLFASEDIAAGEIFSEKNIRSIRPGHGLHPRYYEKILGTRATVSIARGTPLESSHIPDFGEIAEG